MENLPVFGDLSFIDDKITRDCYSDALEAVKNVKDIWEFLRTEEPPEKYGYMFWDNKMCDIMRKTMKFGHSGASFAFTMRWLQYIAKNGWDNWVVEWQKKH